MKRPGSVVSSRKMLIPSLPSPRQWLSLVRQGVPAIARIPTVLTILSLSLAIALPAAAQINLPGGSPGGLGQLASPLTGTVRGATDRVGALAARAQDEAENTLRAPSRLTGLIRRSRGALEADAQGWPIVSGELVAVGMTPDARRTALAEGFTVTREERLDALDLTTAVLAPPRGQSLRRALERLQRLDPTGSYAFNHVHQPAGALSGAPAPRAVAAPLQSSSSARLGLIDTGVEATHPALAGSHVTQRGFAGPPRMGGHGLAVASLMVGRTANFIGAAPGADLFVADVYGGSPAGGSSTALAEALAWMVERRVQVVNISLVGPRNALVQAAVRQAEARGLILVAAVGNDGPAAPPLFPAAYDGVIGVAPVDRRNRILPEAGRGPQVDFSAPGADMAAAGAAGRWVTVRGASFASPLVAGLLAVSSVASLEHSARDLGERGPDPIYGRGLVGETLRTAPTAVGAQMRLAQ